MNNSYKSFVKMKVTESTWRLLKNKLILCSGMKIKWLITCYPKILSSTT